MVVVKENEFILEDRKMKVRSLIEEYGEENCYISYSGGKDSTVVSKIADLALPGNKIPRVYKDTGIEYPQMRKFVKSLCEKDNRFIYLKPSRNIRRTLNEIGYPFKSKQHGHNFQIYKNNISECEKAKTKILESGILERLKTASCNDDDLKLVESLPKGTKTFVKYYFGIREKLQRSIPRSIRERERTLYKFEDCP